VSINKAAFTREYLETILEIIEDYLSPEVYQDIVRMAIPKSGGKAKSNKWSKETSLIEKLSLEEMHPDLLKDVPDKEIVSAWHRLNQWYGAAKDKKTAIENFVNAAIWVSEEMKKRGFQIDEENDLYKTVQEFKTTKKYNVVKRFYDLPNEVVCVRDFVSIVGSAAKEKPNPNDIDILFRANEDNGNYLIQSENVWLPVRNVLDPNKEEELHFIANPQGAHGDYVSCYDLILRKKPAYKREIVKAASEMPDWEQYIKNDAPIGSMFDLGSGNSKPDGFIGIDKNNFDGVDIIADLDYGIPLPDNCAAAIRANHFIEHMSDTEQILTDIFRVLMPGGIAIITVPSMDSEGAAAHPGHKNFFNQSSFDFWTNPELTEDRPVYEKMCVNKRTEPTGLSYIDAVLRKPSDGSSKKIKKIAPGQTFIPPKPQMAGTTEAFELKDLFEWAKDRYPIDIEPKWNGFRSVVSKKGDNAELWFEGQMGKNQLDKLPELKAALEKITGDFVFDADIGIEKNGKRVSRPDLMKFNADNPVFEKDEIPILMIFDLMYRDKDISDLPFEERRKLTERFYRQEVGDKSIIKLSPAKTTNSDTETRAAARWAFDFDMSEGLVAKDTKSTYEQAGTDGWFKLKKVAELKVIVLDKQETKTKGVYNYYGGLLPSQEENWTNTKELNGKEYVDLGKTFSTKVIAEPGDIITVSILELIPDTAKNELAWLGARVQDIDDTRKEPYTTAQAQTIAASRQVIQKDVNRFVPSAGNKNSKVAFIGASPNIIDAARGEAFTGLCGQLLSEMFLQPLGITKQDIFISHVVPELLTNEAGHAREPITKEIDEWKDWIEKEIAAANPDVIVALGRIAKDALGNKADFVMPHPDAINRFGDKGEVSRKIKQVKKQMNKKLIDGILKAAQPDEEGGTREADSEVFWKNNWQDMYPKDGNGRYVYQHHWRGLTEDETKLPESDLLKTDHSLHGDLRFEKDGGLWGFSVFLGKTEDNRDGDRLINLPPEDNLQGAFKLQQPSEWLEVGVEKPYISEPGGVGSTANAWAEFFAQDTGTYEIGVWREHMFEVFLHGDKLKGRFIIEYAPIGGERIWLIDKPKDQTPYAEKNKLEDVISELKSKGQKWLIWAKPGQKPQKINVQSQKIEKEYFAYIIKADDEQQIATGIVLEPNTIDAHGDEISADEIEKAAHFFMKNSRTIGDSHKKKAPADLIESYIAPDDFTLNGQKIKKGTWMISVKILDDKLWKLVKAGFYTGFSVGGFGIREG
jgi:uracil-DNA glycosylase family 4